MISCPLFAQITSRNESNNTNSMEPIQKARGRMNPAIPAKAASTQPVVFVTGGIIPSHTIALRCSRRLESRFC
jgi:hypothetical protein